MISVIIPFYKGNKFINRIIKNIKGNQNELYLYNREKMEIIIINDSPDTPVKIDGNLKKDMPIKIYTNDQNYGIQISRINGIKHSSGEYILLLDQDDILLPYAIKSQRMKIKDADVIISNGFKEAYSNGKIIRKDIYNYRYPILFLRNIYTYLLATNPIVSPGQALIKRISIPNEWLNNPIKNNGSDDLLLWILMIAKRKSIKYNDEKIYIHSETGSNLSSQYDKMLVSDFSVYETIKNMNILSDYQMDSLKRSIIFKGKMLQLTSFNIPYCFKNIDIILFRTAYKLFKLI